MKAESVRDSEDLLLAQRCVAGDASAQRELFHREKRRVHAILYRVLGTNSFMDDLIQEAFLNIFRSLSSYRGEASLGTWVDRCTVRVAYAHLSTKKRRPERLELVREPATDEPDGERRAMARQAARRLYALLDELEPTMRLAFALHELDGKSVADVASAMDATVVATKARIWRARQIVERKAKDDPSLAAFVGDGEP